MRYPVYTYTRARACYTQHISLSRGRPRRAVKCVWITARKRVRGGGPFCTVQLIRAGARARHKSLQQRGAPRTVSLASMCGINGARIPRGIFTRWYHTCVPLSLFIIYYIIVSRLTFPRSRTRGVRRTRAFENETLPDSHGGTGTAVFVYNHCVVISCERNPPCYTRARRRVTRRGWIALYTDESFTMVLL